MLELNFVRDNLAKIEQMLRNRGMDADVLLKDFHQIDAQRRQAINSAETLRAERNRLSGLIPGMKKAGQDTTELIEQTKEMRGQIQELEKAAEEYDSRLTELLIGVPNMPHSSVPLGSSVDDNVEVRRWGSPRTFNFTPKPHWELGE